MYQGVISQKTLQSSSVLLWGPYILHNKVSLMCTKCHNSWRLLQKVLQYLCLHCCWQQQEYMCLCTFVKIYHRRYLLSYTLVWPNSVNPNVYTWKTTCITYDMHAGWIGKACSRHTVKYMDVCWVTHNTHIKLLSNYWVIECCYTRKLEIHSWGGLLVNY